MALLKKLTRNAGANALSAGIVAGFQVLSVPVLLAAWGVRGYSEWIALTALSSYFQLTDVGLSTASANDLSFCSVQGDLGRCNAILTTTVVFIAAGFGALLLLLLLLLHAGVIGAILRFKDMAPAELNASLLLLLAQVFVGTMTNVLTGVYRAADGFARGVMVDNGIRAGEYSSILLAATLGLTIPAVLSVQLGVKCFGLCAKSLDAHRLFRFNLRPRHFSLNELRALWVPAVAFFSFPISNSLALQAPILIVNFFLGSTAVVAFSTTRRLANLCRSAVDIIQKSTWPELSVAYGRRDARTFQRLHLSISLASVGVAVAFAVTLAFLGPWAYRAWTLSRVGMHYTLFYLFLLTPVSSALWTSTGTLLQASNNHGGLAVAYLLLAVGTLIVSGLIAGLAHNVDLLPIPVIASDLLLFAYARKRARETCGAAPAGMRALLAAASSGLSRALKALSS